MIKIALTKICATFIIPFFLPLMSWKVLFGKDFVYIMAHRGLAT